MKKIALTFLCLLLSAAVFAQSAAMLTMARGELQKRGLEEGAVRARLLENGIDVDNIPPSEYPAFQDRVLAILNQMQKEKAAENAALVVPDTVIVAQDEAPQTTPDESAAEKALQEVLNENKVPAPEREVYGHSLFTGKSMEIFRTTDGAQAPDTYVMGEGDEVHISIFGSSQTELHQRIAPDGSIQPTGSTKIFIKGLTLAQARSTIKSKLSQHYSFRPDQIAITITTARTITVSIYGEVGVQGGFTLSALNTAFNALAAAGGPTEMGSLRNIQRSRGGKTTRLDLYQFMIGAASGAQYDLQNNDILFVPVAEKIVSIEGAVNRPMLYEVTDGETLKDLIKYAGGLAYDAYPEYVQVERYVNGEKSLQEYNLSQVMSGSQSVTLQGGDIVRVKAIKKPMENYVNISGDVFYDGSYDLKKNRSLQVLLDNAQPRYTAQTDYVLVKRTHSDETVETITVPFPGVNGNPDFTLQARDAVLVMKRSDHRNMANITVTGEVHAPFTRSVSLGDHISVGQAIDIADGLKPSVYPVAYIFRQDLSNPSKMTYIPVNLEKDRDMLLQAGDELRIYDNSTYTNAGEVRIAGAVKNPTGVTFDPSLSLHDLITMAGGFEVGAAFNRVEIFRTDLSNQDEVKYTQFPITVDENYNPLDPNFTLQPFDHVIVRQMPNYRDNRTVEINGRVRYPGEYVLPDSRVHLSEIIEMAGGLLDDAVDHSSLFRTYNGRGRVSMNLKDAMHHKQDTRFDPILMDGDVINIMRAENTVVIRETGTRMAQYVPADFAATQKVITYQGRHRADWYIKQYAGGFQKYADKNSVTVTLANNETKSTKKFLFFRSYPVVEPGSVITLSIDTKRQEKAETPKEPVHWEQVASSSLSALTSIVSMIVLIERLN